MTADVELLPLPKWGGAQIVPDSLIENYARACVSSATAAKDAEIEALRAEVERLTALIGGVEVQRDANWQAYSDEKARAERLAEALRDLLSWFPEKPAPSEWRICAGEQGADDAIEYARAALHPTAAQENDDA